MLALCPSHLTYRDAQNTEKCHKWKAQYAVVPGASWGDLPFQLQEEWKSINCDEYLVEVKDIVPSSDCTSEKGQPARRGCCTERELTDVREALTDWGLHARCAACRCS